MDDLREDLQDQRAKLMFHIEQVKRHLSQLESGAVRITAGHRHLSTVEIRQMTQLYVEKRPKRLDFGSFWQRQRGQRLAQMKARCCRDGGPPEGDIPTPICLSSIHHAVY